MRVPLSVPSPQVLLAVSHTGDPLTAAQSMSLSHGFAGVLEQAVKITNKHDALMEPSWEVF
jgi:hypothetical protein